MEDNDQEPNKTRDLLAMIGAVLSVIAMGTYVSTAAINIYSTTDPIIIRIVYERFPVIIGLPSAAITSFVVVVQLRQTSGPMNFEFLGMKFEGSSGQVAMWLVCFLGIVGAIKILW